MAIYVKNSILYNTLLNFPDLNGYLRSLFIICILYTVRKDLVPDNLEMICIEITKQHSRPFLVTCWYRPPNSEQAIFLDFEMFFLRVI